MKFAHSFQLSSPKVKNIISTNESAMIFEFVVGQLEMRKAVSGLMMGKGGQSD